MEDKFTWEESKAFNFGLLSILVFSGLFFFMAFSQHDYKHIDKNFYHVNASFGRTDGLLVGDKVRMAGVDVGRVVDAKLDPNYNAILKLEIKDGLKIPDDSSASIVSSGLMGSKYIEIEPGGSEEYIPNDGEFSYTQDAMVLEELLDRIVAIGKAKHKEDAKCMAEQETQNQIMVSNEKSAMQTLAEINPSSNKLNNQTALQTNMGNEADDSQE